MKFFPQHIAGVFLIEPEPFVDERGVFRRHFCQREFEAHGLSGRISQCNVSENKYKYTLRGFHYQLSPYAEGKTLSCLVGSAYDIVVDLREGSKTYLQWQSFEINAQNRRSVYVPPGCGNAFMTLEDNSLLYYYCSEFYFGASERGIRHNDPFFKFVWPQEPQWLSDKDKNHPDFVPAKR